jgi:hypothetical protein
MALASAAYIMFSGTIQEYRSIDNAILVLFRGAFTSLNYAQLVKRFRTVGPIFFFVFELIINLIILNIFIAILNDGYTEVRQTN